MMNIAITIAIEMVEKIDFNHITLVIPFFIIKKINSNLFNDIFAIKWLISIISMHGIIEKIQFKGAQL